MSSLKPQAEKIRECTIILNKITQDLGIWSENPSIKLLRKKMGEYWRSDAILMEDKIPLVGTNRYIVYRFPRLASQPVEITLRAGQVMHFQLPEDPAAAPAPGTRSETQSDPEYPSQTPSQD